MNTGQTTQLSNRRFWIYFIIAHGITWLPYFVYQYIEAIFRQDYGEFMIFECLPWIVLVSLPFIIARIAQKNKWIKWSALCAGVAGLLWNISYAKSNLYWVIEGIKRPKPNSEIVIQTVGQLIVMAIFLFWLVLRLRRDRAIRSVNAALLDPASLQEQRDYSRLRLATHGATWVSPILVGIMLPVIISIMSWQPTRVNNILNSDMLGLGIVLVIFGGIGTLIVYMIISKLFTSFRKQQKPQAICRLFIIGATIGAIFNLAYAIMLGVSGGNNGTKLYALLIVITIAAFLIIGFRAWSRYRHVLSETLVPLPPNPSK